MKYRVIGQNKKDRMNERQQETTTLRKRNTGKQGLSKEREIRYVFSLELFI
jgi:hypothetical protein